MSKVFSFSGSFIYMVAVALLFGLSIQTGSCQSFATDTSEMTFKPLDVEEDGDGRSAMANINSQDVLSVVSSSDGPLGLWSGLKTEVMFGDDGSIQKSRTTGLFSIGSDMLSIYESSWLSIENDYGFTYETSPFELESTLFDARYPFFMFREDQTRISYNPDLINSSLTPLLSDDTISTTYLLLYDDYYDHYDMALMDEAFGDSTNLIYKSFEYNPELNNMSDSMQINLSQYFTQDIWDQFGDIFKNDEIMAMFNKYAKEQLANQNKPKDNEEMQNYIINMFSECESGVCCKWGTT